MQKEDQIFIVGGGLAGCVLALTLDLHFKQKICLIDNHFYRNASLVAAGIFNPITGKRTTKTKSADLVFPFLFKFYPEIEKKLNTKFFYPNGVVKPFDNLSEQNDWMGKSSEGDYQHYIKVYNQISESEYIKTNYGGIEIGYSGWMDCETFLKATKQYFTAQNAYLQEKIEFEQLKERFGKEAKVIFCEGWQASQNPLWEKLPWNLAKGEVMNIKTDYYSEKILNKSVFICPKKEKNIAKVGSTYIWKDVSNNITEKGRLELTEKLSSFYALPFEITSFEAEIRPTTKFRLPFLGKHPSHENYYIFNGFGSKTVSLGPYYAQLMAEFILQKQKLPSEVDIEKILG